MKIIQDKEKYLYSWRYVELAHYVPSLDRVIRDKSGNSPLMIDIDSIDEYRKKHGNTGLYTSIWLYNSKDIDNAIRLGSLYFDIDSDIDKESLFEAQKLYSYLSNYIPEKSIIVYFTGKKGFHIECEAYALGINPSNNLPNIYRFIATKLKQELSLSNIDFSVYDARRMWRLPGSKHQSTGLYKNIINNELLFSNIDNIKSYCEQQQDNSVEEQTFDAKANEWFREFTYNLEVEKEKSKDFIGYFNKYGSTAFKKIDDREKEFTPKNLLEKCPSVKRLWQQAIDKKHLEHEARLFLCSLLTYNKESVEFLHGILSNCNDYNVEKTTSHINDWIRRREMGIGGRPYTCERANAAGVGCGSCELDKRNKWVKIGDKYVETTEQSSPSPVRFAYTVKQKGGKDVIH